MVFVEVGIYWVHRKLHTNKFLYNWVHLRHHSFFHEEELSPFASIAFNPLDGILQASPYIVVALFIPTHFWTHLILFFFTAIWATYIHDGLKESETGIVMGSRYHTVYHTHLVYNYGQIFIFADAFFGTLRDPTEL